MAHFHCSSLPLQPDSVIDPGNWGRIIRNAGWSHNLSGRETILEHVRKNEFPHKPSRLDASFFFDNETEARFYAGSDGRHLTMLTYEVELLEPDAVQHIGDWRNVAAKGPLDLSWASNYWAGEMLPPHSDPAWPVQCREILAVTALRIVRRL